jgi:hypothetical protein
LSRANSASLGDTLASIASWIKKGLELPLM